MIDQALRAIKQMRLTEPDAIVREVDLGKRYALREALPNAENIVAIYRLIPVDTLKWLSLQQLESIKNSARKDTECFSQALNLTPSGPTFDADRQRVIKAFEYRYDASFSVISPILAFAASQSSELQTLRATVSSETATIQQRFASLAAMLDSKQSEADRIVESLRAISGKVAVTKEAIHFQTEAAQHEQDAKKWLTLTGVLTVWLGMFAIGALFLHKIPLLAPTNTYETVQLVVGKALIFSTIAYFMILSAKNFLAHRHNAIVNKHRQNALSTYRAIVEAGGDAANRDIILTKAAECIFAPQPTGFGRADAGEPASISMVSLAPGAFKPPGSSS